MRTAKYYRRKKRVGSKIKGTSDRPRLSVFRSNKTLYAQVIDDTKAKTLFGMSTKALGKTRAGKGRVEEANLFGQEFAKKAKTKKISKVVFDRSGYRYHGRVKAFAEGVREGGLKF